MVAMKPSELIYSLMKKKGMRPVDLERRTGLGRSTIERHLDGRIEPSIDQREKYAAAYKIPFDEFERRWQEEESEAAPPEMPPAPAEVKRMLVELMAKTGVSIQTLVMMVEVAAAEIIGQGKEEEAVKPAGFTDPVDHLQDPADAASKRIEKQAAEAAQAARKGA